MSDENAIAFLREARRREDVTEALAELEGRESWDELVRLASDAGFHCTADELNRAFVLDWRLRWVRYQPAGQQIRE